MKLIKSILIVLIAAIGTFSAKAYTYHVPIHLVGASSITIAGDSIVGGSQNCIWLENCSNVTIQACYLGGSSLRGVRMDNCNHITIINNVMKNDSNCVYAFHCTGFIHTDHNTFRDFFAQAVQYNNCTGPGQTINYNKVKITIGAGDNPTPKVGDLISLYKTFGVPFDPVRVYGNTLVGGGSTSGVGLGYAGIVAGDVGGGYQDIRNNRLVNTGYVGIQQQGGSHITIRYNFMYSDLLPWSGVGLASANYSGVPAVNNDISYNYMYYKAGYPLCGCGGERDTSYKAGTGGNSNALPAGWLTNHVHVTSLSAGSIPSF